MNSAIKFKKWWNRLRALEQQIERERRSVVAHLYKTHQMTPKMISNLTGKSVGKKFIFESIVDQCRFKKALATAYCAAKRVDLGDVK